ncbi:MAG: DMT family transporter, partial [Alphaproteobacteria bacterium]|nr:DMT family transporter [Alphaproteobacteria bacterium]
MAGPRETPPPTPAADRRSFGVLVFCVGMLMFCIGDAFGKQMTLDGVPIVMVVWARYAGSLAFLVALMPFMGWRRVAGTARVPIQLARGAFVVCATTLFFAGLQFMTMADATGINFVSPLFVAAMAAIFLGEHVGARRWTAIG